MVLAGFKDEPAKFPGFKYLHNFHANSRKRKQ
jgi:hypothetical protein